MRSRTERAVWLQPPSWVIGKPECRSPRTNGHLTAVLLLKASKGISLCSSPSPLADTELVHQWIWGKNGSSFRIVVLTKALRWLSTVHCHTPAIIYLHLPVSPKASMGKGCSLGPGWVFQSNWACVEKGTMFPQVGDNCRWKENANPEIRSSG